MALSWDDGLEPWVEGFEAIVFRTVGDQVSLWEAVLPPELLKLPDELARVDALLDDPVFFAPFAPFFDLRVGRPSTPVETYLRLMFLKFRYGLGFESLCREVSDSITWRRFCRIALDGAVPHPTTLMKLNTRCGSAAMAGLNEALLAKAAEAKVLRTNRVRADTTVMPANVCYPTDSGLLAKAIRRIGTAGQRIHNAGGAVRTRLRDRSRAAGKRAHGIAAKLRSRSQLGRDQVNDACSGLPVSSPIWPGPRRATRNACWSMPGERCAEHTPRRHGWERRAPTIRSRDGAAGGWPAPSTTCRTCCKPPPRSPSRPGNGSPGAPPMEPAGWSACSTAMPARSPRAGWGNPSSSVTRARSSTTTTASSWITRCMPETPPTHHNWPRRSNESKHGPVVHHGP
jgi:IS5 family transposase